ncbi:hypothetical protein HKD37_11G032137 [Glycine soja]
MMQSYPPRVLDRRLQEAWARATKEGPRVLMNLRVFSFFWALYFGHSSSISGWRLLSPLLICLPLHLHGGKSPLKDLIEAQDPASIEAPQASFHQVVSEHKSFNVNGEGTSHKDPLSRILDELSSIKKTREKRKRKKRVEEISQDERKKIREEERRKIMKEMKREKHASYSSHNSCKSLSEELCDYYEGRHRSYLRHHSHRREMERKPQEANINLPYFHGKDNVVANLDWEIRVEQQLKKKSTSKSYGSHSYPKKDQGQGILGVTPSKPKDDKGKTIEKQAPKASMQEKTSSIKCYKCLGRGHITSQCSTTKTMIMRGQDIYSSQDEATTSPSSSESEEAKGEKSSEEIYPQEEEQPLVVKEKCKEVSVSSKSLAKKETHFTIKTNIKETFPLRQPPHFLFCKKTLAKKHQVPKIGGMMNVLNGATIFCKITHAPNIFMVCVHRDPLGSFNTNLGTHMGHLRFVEGMMQSYPPRVLDRRLKEAWARATKEGPRILMNLRVFSFFWALYFGHSSSIGILSKLLIQGSSWWWSSFFHGLFPSGWRLLSPLLICLPLHLHGGKSPLKDLIEAQDPASIEAPQASFHQDFCQKKFLSLFLSIFSHTSLKTLCS